MLHNILITVFIMRMPISYYFFGAVFHFFLILGVRYVYRLYLILRRRYTRDYSSLKRVMIIGAGEAGRNIIREIQSSEEMHEIPVCVIDGNQTKWNKQIEGVPIKCYIPDFSLKDNCKEYIKILLIGIVVMLFSFVFKKVLNLNYIPCFIIMSLFIFIVFFTLSTIFRVRIILNIVEMIKNKLISCNRKEN